MSPLLHPALSSSLSRSFGLSSPFSLSSMSTSLQQLSGSPGRLMALGRSFEERPRLEAQFFSNFNCCGLDLKDLHGLLEHFEECHVAFDESDEPGMDVEMDMEDGGSEGTISGPPSPRLQSGGQALRSLYEVKKSTLSAFDLAPSSPATAALHLDSGMELDMEMDDTPIPSLNTYALPATTRHTMSISTGTSTTLHASGSTSSYPPPMSAFDGPLQLAGTSKKKFSTAMNAHALNGNMRGLGGMMGLEALAAARAASAYSTPDSSVPGTPVMEEVPGGGVDGLFSNSSITPSSLAPSLLFPTTPVESPPSDSGSNHDGSNSGTDSKESTPHMTALGPGALSALPSSLHPLGSGVQISPSGRPYTPPSEKPFKCNVVGCDKSYKQQNGLKYHRLHGHCNQNNVGKEGHEVRGEGKPYVCHVTSCGKRYKKYVPLSASELC